MEELFEYSKKFYGVVYKINFNTTDKVYIGKTTNFRRRVKEYRSLENKDTKKTNYKIANYIREVGFSDLDFEILDVATNEQELNEKEIFWIKETEALDPNKGFNVKTGGTGGSLKSDYSLRSARPFLKDMHTPEVKRKKSKSIVAFKDNEFSIYEGAVLFANEYDLARTNVIAVIKGKGLKLKGYYLYYLDDICEMEQLYKDRESKMNSLKSKGSKYKAILEYLEIFNIIKKGVEAIENNEGTEVRYIRYE